LQRQGDLVGGVGIIAEADVKGGVGWVRGFGGMWDGEGIADEAFGDGGWGGKGLVGGEGVDEVEVGAFKGAGLLAGVGGAVDVGECGQADEGGEGDPVAGGAVGGDGAEMERTVCLFWRTRVPAAMLSLVWRESSVLAISICWSRG
jgi:hypothetical protein